MKKTFFTCLALVCTAAVSVNAQTVHWEHTFDGVANDSTPAAQTFDNGAGTPMVDLASGLIMNAGSSGGGFNTTASIDLSAESEFTIEFVVENNSSLMNGAGLNGNFFGITSSATSNATDGSALYNNAGSTSGPAFGLQVGPGRGGSVSSYVFDNVGGNGAFTDLANAFADDGTDGYTVFVNYADTGLGTTDVTITTTGLATDINFAVNESIAFSSYANEVTPNISSQGGTIDVASIRLFSGSAIPEPTSLSLLGLAGLMFVRRRQRV